MDIANCQLASLPIQPVRRINPSDIQAITNLLLAPCCSLPLGGYDDDGLALRLIGAGFVFALAIAFIGMRNIEEEVKKIISEQLGVPLEKVTPDAKFIENLGADSLDLVELVMAAEELFNITIPDEESEKLATVSQAIEYIKAHAKE